MSVPDPIRFEDVSLEFSGEAALSNVSLDVARGAIKVLLGETGSGKSVVLKLMLGLLRPSAGRIEVLGEEIEGRPESELFALRRRIGMVFQENALFDSLSVFGNVAYRLEEEHQLSEAAVADRVRTCLSFVELDEAVDKMPEELSGGMRRRVSIARALATEPELMLYDSPTAGLDPITAATIVELIVKLRDVNNVTSVLVTHRLQDAFTAATHRWDAAGRCLKPVAAARAHTSFLVLRHGRVVFDGAPEQLLASPDSYLQQLLQGVVGP